MRPPHQQCAVEACGISQRTALPTRRRFWQRPRIAAVGWSSQRGDSPAIRRVKTWAADGGRTDLETSVRRVPRTTRPGASHRATRARAKTCDL